jgi:hypothetical protein
MKSTPENFVNEPRCTALKSNENGALSRSIAAFGLLLSALLAASMRVHQYRNLHSAAVYRALCQLDRCDQS